MEPENVWVRPVEMNMEQWPPIQTNLEFNTPFSGKVGEVVYEQAGDRAILTSVVVWEEGLPADKWQAQYIRHVLSPHTPQSLQTQTGLQISFNCMLCDFRTVQNVRLVCADTNTP
jgi:hypothetical protein